MPIRCQFVAEDAGDGCWVSAPYDARKPWAAGRLWNGGSMWVSCDGCGETYEDPEPWMQCPFCGCLIEPLEDDDEAVDGP